MKDKNVEYQAGAALVDEGIEFKIDGFFGKKITLNIKPQKPGSNIRISQKVVRLTPLADGTVQEFMAMGRNIEIIAGIIATALVNREIFKLWKYRWYKWLMLNKVKDMAHLYSYFLLVQRQMGPVFFYRIMNLTPAMNYLMKMETKKTEANTGEGKPSGEPLL